MAKAKKETLTLPLLIARGLVLYPKCSQFIEVGRVFSLAAVENAQTITNSLILVVSQKNVEIDEPTFEDVYQYGTLCRIASATQRGNTTRIKVEPLERVKLESMHLEEFHLGSATVDSVPEVDEETNYKITAALMAEIEKIPQIYRRLPKTVLTSLQNASSAVTFCYIIADFVQAETVVKQNILEINEVEKLYQAVLRLVLGEKVKDEVEDRIQEIIRESTDKSQKEYFLREKLKAVKQELGEGNNKNDVEKIKERLENEPFPQYVKDKIYNEINKLEMMPGGSLEASLIQNYIDTMLAVPWYQKTEDNDDLNNVEKILDEDHYGLQKAKQRILEYLAVKKLTGNLKSPILCFYGPPGCGKTSLGMSIARALNRKFFKASLGGISDEAEIRGHRRTYVGALPGRIISGMKKAGVTNPVFLLDEIDKLASSYKGDPASAMLEVLDPEQNFAFNDNFIEEPYDLSDVLFICTANYLENIPAPLRDRLELIEIPSYTEIEKLHIAEEHLVAKQTKLNGLKEDQVKFTTDAILYIIRRYTREAGVRWLERRIASCLRKVAVHIVKNPDSGCITIDVDKVKEYLENEVFDNSDKEKEPQIGVVTGLAYTEYGGDILPIEVNYFEGKGGFVLTGKLGEVMKESCAIALDYVKSNAAKYGIDPELFQKNDIHIHVPEGAVPKDGPSAGVAITIAIISCLAKKHVDNNVAMTGEVTLRGHALPIGGLREKSLAALRSGIKTIIIPKANERDLVDLPQEVKDSLKIIFMENVDDALKIALID